MPLSSRHEESGASIEDRTSAAARATSGASGLQGDRALARAHGARREAGGDHGPDTASPRTRGIGICVTLRMSRRRRWIVDGNDAPTSTTHRWVPKGHSP
jgi:hypothetical protein